ncbi:hypothetical protein F5Y13DRAFT_152929 [Hypoxylon sp. FL1857]|nr:hypothetical protein F5Y13DRAFT_152929 [Hypoxylon sp. FL1857]
MASYTWSPKDALTNPHKSQLDNLTRNKVTSGRVTKNGSSTKRNTFGGLGDDIEEKGSGGALSKTAQKTVKNEDVRDSIEEDEPQDDDDDPAGWWPFDETSEPVDKILIENPQALLNHYLRVMRGSAPRQESPESTSARSTNTDYDSEEWRYEQIFLNQILNGRDEYTLMPTTWKMHFRGIPLPEDLFYIKTKDVSVRPRVYARAHKLEYRGAIALRRLIDLHSRIRDLRKAGNNNLDGDDTDQIVKQTKKRLMDALLWADLDGGITKHKKSLPSNVKILEIEDPDRLSMDMHMHIQYEMDGLAARWRESLAGVPEQERPRAPVLFGFVIFRHILLIVTLDADSPGAACHIPCQLNLSERNQHQWNALAIMVTVCWARDLFEKLAKNIPQIDDSDQHKDSDPDA